MKLLRKIWFKFLKAKGYSIFVIHKKSISIIEEKLSQLNDEEHFVVMQMLDDGYNCNYVCKKIYIARKNRSFKRKLKELEINDVIFDYFLNKYSIIINENTNIDALVNKINQEYLLKLEKDNTVN